MAEIDFNLSQSGGEEVANVFDQIAASELGAGAETKRFRDELAKVQRASGQAVTGLDKLKRSSDLVTQSARGLAVQTVQVKVPMEAWSSALGGLGSQLGGISPEMDALSTSIGAVSTGMATAASMPGPWGVAMGALTTAIGIGTSAIRLYNAHATEFAERQREAAEQTAALGLSVEQAAVARLEASITESNARVSRLRTDGSNEEFVQESANLRALQAMREEALRPMRERAALAEQLAREEYNRGQAAAETQRFAESNARTMAEINAIFNEIETSAGRGAEAFRTMMEDREQRLRNEIAFERELLVQAADEELAIRREVDADMRREAERLFSEEKALQREKEGAIREHLEREKTMRLEAIEALREKEADALDLQKEQIREAQQSLQDELTGVLGPAISGFTGAIKEMMAGTKSADEAFKGLLSSFLEMISERAALEAAAQFAQAIGDFASQNYVGGAGHLAAGVAWTAVAVASGAASVAVAPPAASAQPASPPQSAEPAPPGGNTYVLQLNGGVVTSSTHAELGRELGSALVMGERRFSGRL